MRVSENFFKDIHTNSKEVILNKLKNFKDAIEESNCINDVPKGFWIRRIVGTDIYKFRVNNGDRILFTFDKNNDDELVFLKYCKHDDQIVDGKSMDKNINLHIEKSLELDLNEYIEDTIDENIQSEIDNYITLYTSKGLEDLITIVLEDEYIALALDEDSDEYLYYLNESQFECLKVLGKPVIISGCAGSGKTMIGIYKLIHNNDLNIKSAYIAYSPFLKNKSKEYFNKFVKNDNSCVDFICLNEMFANQIGIKYSDIKKFSDFENWFVENHDFNEELSLDISILYNEINKINMYKDDYNNDEFDKNQVKFIQKTYTEYEKWIRNNKYIDEIRLAEKFIELLDNKKIELDKYDFIFVDEIQDLREIHLKCVDNLLNIKQNIMLSGDINQIINDSNFDFKTIKNIFYNNNIPYEEKFINKNYRNTSGVVNFINKLIDLRINKLGKSKKEYDKHEEFIRDGKKPYIIPYTSENLDLLSESVDEREYCAIVVPSYSEKHKLIINGINEDRIFTIEEIKGLEYKNIFCINFITRYKNSWDLINRGSSLQYLRHFINIFYVAITRGINIVAFLEEDTNLINKLFDNNLLNSLKNIDLQLLEMDKVTEFKDWFKEALRLENSMNYKKAYYAYKKANDLEGMERCKKYIKNIQDDYINRIFGREYETAIRIEKNFEPITSEDISMSLNTIFSKHMVYSEGNVQIVIQKNDGSTIISDMKNIKPSILIKGVSLGYEDFINDIKDINRHKVTLYMTFLKNGNPIKLNISGNEAINLIRVNINNDSLILEYEYLESLSASNMIKQLAQMMGISMDDNNFSINSEEQDDFEDFKIFDSIINDSPISNFENILSSATYANNTGNINEAIKYYKQALNNIDEYINEIDNTNQLNRFAENIEKEYSIKINNIEEYKKSILFSIYNDLASCYKNKKNNEEAYEAFLKCIENMVDIESNPNSLYSNIFLLIGDIFITENDYDEAFNYFSKAKELGDSRAIKGFALVYSKKENYGKALRYISEYIKLEPNDINAHIKIVEYFVSAVMYLQIIESTDEFKSYFLKQSLDKYYKNAFISYNFIKQIPNIYEMSDLVRLFEYICQI